MPDKYTVLPSANSVLCVFVNNGKINTYYNGTNTKAVVVGEYANKNDMLLLIKFRPGGFFPFYGFNQNEFIDFSMELSSKVSLCFRNGFNNITLTGTVEVSQDNKLREELWKEWCWQHFPDGPTGKHFCIYIFTTEEASLWIEGEAAEIKGYELANL